MLELRGISKRMAGFSLRDVSFGVEQGDYFILLGESGAGKSMILETIAGLVAPDSGTILLNGKDITSEKIQNRTIGMVFQDHAIFPHLTVEGNIAYSLHGADIPKEEKKRRVKAIASELGIRELLKRRPGTLSGGELQRVSLGRTLIQHPSVLLLDEPLSSLDTRLKSDLRRLLRSINRNGQTIVHVTHDYEEAISLATRIAVINQGTIIQTGTPSEVFSHPKSEFVANFIGLKNFFKVTLVRDQDVTYACLSDQFRVITDTGLSSGEGFILIREEEIQISLGEAETGLINHFNGRIVEIVQNSRGVDVTIDAGFELHALITRESLSKLDLETGTACWVHFNPTVM